MSYFGPQATGGQNAAKINHQAAVAAVFGTELLIEPAALHPGGTSIASWVLTLEQVDDIAIKFNDGAVTSVQVKDQKLGRRDVDSIVNNWMTAPGSPTSRALRVCGLQGLIKRPVDLSALAASLKSLREYARQLLRTCFETPCVRLASGASFHASVRVLRTQGGCNGSAIAPTEDAAAAQIRRRQTCARGFETRSQLDLEQARSELREVRTPFGHR